jgi:hypothetical protein
MNGGTAREGVGVHLDAEEQAQFFEHGLGGTARYFRYANNYLQKRDLVYMIAA